MLFSWWRAWLTTRRSKVGWNLEYHIVVGLCVCVFFVAVLFKGVRLKKQISEFTFQGLKKNKNILTSEKLITVRSHKAPFSLGMDNLLNFLSWNAASKAFSRHSLNAYHQFLPMWIYLHEWKLGICGYLRSGVMRESFFFFFWS